MVTRLRWIRGKALAWLGIKDHLSMEKEYAQVQVQSRCSETKPTGKNEKIAKNEKAAKTRVSHKTGNLEDEIFLRGVGL